MPGDFSFSSEVAPVCEVGISDVAQAEPDSWLDVSCNVHEAELERGRDRFNDRFQPGTATITFKNTDGWADLVGDYTAVELTTLRPGRPIRVGVIGPFDGGPIVTRWLFRGYIDHARPTYDPVETDTVTVTCIDAFGEAGMRQLLGGPLVGVNEAVHTRINRVLNARGWWNAKRSIATGTALMQGVRMEGSTSDLLTTPADSAGGIIFGDVNGNVVYRDIDWELYDPDTPHDGEIGNCDPGQVPSAGTPPYIDPTKGTVYNETPDPPTHPRITHFCAGPGGAGTILERGEAYVVFIKGIPPHLYLTENGHTWDLGVWNDIEGGCVTIEHPTPPPTGTPPNTPPTPPRILPNPPTPPGTPPEKPGVPPTPTDQPPQEVPPTGGGGGGGGGGPEEVTFGVELLGHSDGGLADPALGTVVVPGITPGPGRLLIVLACALCDNVTGSLTPFPIAGGSITGGGVTFDEIGREPSGGDGAESYAAAGRTGRTDPGTFDVTVDWSGAHASREHIVTVWGVRRERADMLDRLKLGSYLRSLTWDRIGGVPPSPNPPGKGFWQTAFENPATDTPPYPRLSDITIAQSLAESPNPPFGAKFNTADGQWTTPVFIAGPTATLRDIASVSFSDDFERTAIGSNWAPTAIPTNPGTPPGAASIDTGAVVNAHNTDGYLYYTAPIPGDHFLELTISAWKAGAGASGRNAHVNVITCLADPAGFTTTSTQMWTRWYIAETSEGGMVYGGPGLPSEMQIFIAPADTFRFRIESTQGGTVHRLFIDDVLANEQITEPIVGDYIAFQPYWNDSYQSPRIEAATVGVPTGACDHFDRLDGPVGPTWMLGPYQSFAGAGNETTELMTIEDQAAVGPGPFGLAPIPSASMMLVAPGPADHQWTEITVDNVWQTTGTPNDFACQIELWNYIDMSTEATTWAGRRACQFIHDSDGVSITAQSYASAGSIDDPGGANHFASTDVPGGTMTLRFDTYADGRCVVTYNGAVVIDVTLAGVIGAGLQQGIYMIWTGRPASASSPRLTGFCGTGGGGGGIVRKCSWVAGYRGPLTPPQLSPADVKWDTVNTGPDDLQSCQACVVVEPLLPDQFGWRTLAYYARAPVPPVTLPPTSHSSTVRYERNSIVLVYVAAFAATDIAAGITVGSSRGLTFAVARLEPLGLPFGHGQGVVFWAKTPDLALAPDASDVITVAWGAALEGVNYLIEEVTNGAAVAATASDVFGDHSLGSVTDGVATTLSAAPATSSVVLGFLGCLGEPSESGADPGLGWVEEVEFLPSGEWTYLEAQSRVGSADPLVQWTDASASSPTGPQISDAVVLAVEVTPGPSYVDWETTGGLTIGGSLDAYNGQIYNVDERDASGDIIWSFGPGDPH